MDKTFETGKKLVELCKAGKHLEAIDKLYAPNIVSLEVHGTPEMPARMEGIAAIRKKGKWWQKTERAYDWLVGGYRWTLQVVLEHRALTLLICGGLFLITIGLFYVIPKGFIPNDDTSRIVGYTEAAEGISFAEMSRHQEQMVNLIRADPNVVGVLSTVGQSDVSAASNSGNILVLLKPIAQRSKDVDTIIEDLRPTLATVPGIQIFLQNPPLVQVGGQVTKSPYQLTLQGADRNELYANAETLQRKMAALPQLLDVTSDLQTKNPQLNVDIDRDKASSLGISAQQIEDALNDAYGTKQISTIYATSNEYQVIMEVKPEYQEDPSALGRLYIHSTAAPSSSSLSFSHACWPRSSRFALPNRRFLARQPMDRTIQSLLHIASRMPYQRRMCHMLRYNEIYKQIHQKRRRLWNTYNS